MLNVMILLKKGMSQREKKIWSKAEMDRWKNTELSEKRNYMNRFVTMK